MSEQLNFPASYDAVEVPLPIRSMDSIDEQVQETQEAFFKEVADSLQLSRHALAFFCSIRHRMLVPLEPSQSRLDRVIHGSDDYVSEFWYNDQQPLATVLKTRDEWNWQVASFARYPLLPRVIASIQTINSKDAPL